MNITPKQILILCAAVWIAGCTSTKTPEPPPEIPSRRDPAVSAADSLYEQGRMREAIIACIDIARKNPEAVGLLELQQRITNQMAADRAREIVARTEKAVDLDTADAQRFGIPPDNYRMKKHVVGENNSLRSAPSSMQEALMSPISVHLIDADINAIIAQIGQAQNINIVADSSISSAQLSIHAEDTPLIEILEYVGRNLDVTFSVGSNLIWATAKSEEEPTTGVPMITRTYKLRKGMVGSELGKSAAGKSLFKGPEERGRGSRENQQQGEEGGGKEGSVGLLEAIERFVPQPDGADFLFNDKVHSLIVKNTRENLDLVEDLIEAMDVRPLQVLIEARFITTKVNDLRELGIDWLFQRPYEGDTGLNADTIDELRRLQRTTEDPAQLMEIDQQIQALSPTTFGNNVYAGQIASTGTDAIYQTLLGETGLQATLHALQEIGNSRTVVVPRVTTLNNREATFRFGRDVSYFEEVDTNIMTSGGGYGSGESRDNVTYDYDRPTVVEVGYSLTVTPSVGADLSTINLVLRPEISNIEEWKKYKLSSLDNAKDPESEPAIEIPIIGRQYIETEAVVRSGETVVLGGMADTLKSEDNKGTPWLSDLPFIGRFFRLDTDNEQSNNMLIFVTATLISDMGEELIPLSEREHYGLELPTDATTPDVLKNIEATAPQSATDGAQAPAAEAPAAEAPTAEAPAAEAPAAEAPAAE